MAGPVTGTGPVIGCPGCFAPVYSAAKVTSAVDAAYHEFTASTLVHGMAVAVISPLADGALTTTTFEFGDAKIEVGRTGQTIATPVTASTQFEIGSETKVFTGALLAQAVEQGAVTESEHVNKLAPAGDVPTGTGCARAMTLKNLATHRAGLPDDPPNFIHSSTGHRTYSSSDLFTGLADTALLFCPGSGWSYSDFGFGLLGTLLAQTESTPFKTVTYGGLLDAQITGPLEMTATELEPYPTPPSTLATPYTATGAVGWDWDNTDAMAGGGGLISSITDMATFVRAQLGDGPAAIVKTLKMTQVPVAPGMTGDSYFHMGLGWQIYYPETGIRGHLLFKNGGTDGMSSATLLVPKEHLGVTVLSNEPTGPNKVAFQIVEQLLGAPPVKT